MAQEGTLGKIQKSNRVAKGSVTEVQPIRKKKDIEGIKKILSGSPRDFLLFVMGINNGLRASDLLNIKVGDVRHMNSGQVLKIREKKTKRINILVVNKVVNKALQNYLEILQPEDDHFLFRSRKGENQPLKVRSVNKLIKTWTKIIRLKGNYGTHSLRKTWGYHQRVYHNVGVELISKRFGHSSIRTTMRYLGISDDEITGILMNEI